MEREHEKGGITATEILKREEEWEERRDRLAILRITSLTFLKMLQNYMKVPDNFNYTHATYDYDSDSFKIMVQCDEFPKKRDGMPIPLLDIELVEETPDGKKEIRWSLPAHSDDPRYAYLEGYQAGLEAAQSESNPSR